MKKSLTIIDNGSLRGVLAPAHAMPKTMLEDIIDFIELSDPRMARESRMLIFKASKDHSWIPLKAIRSPAKKRK